MKNTLLLLSIGLLVLVAACTGTQIPSAETIDEQSTQVEASDVQEDMPYKALIPTTDDDDQVEVVNVADADEIKVLPDGTKYLIHPNQLRGGGPPKDGIPSIDDPKFISVEEADRWLADDELGAAIIHKGVKRFYPFQILVWHEIVNDDVAGDPVLITYCPLCGSVIGYEGTIDGEKVEFGTSGKLYNSNLVMYDRKTDSYWTQIEGRVVVGPLTGMELKLFPVDVVTWGDWRKVHQESEVLSRETGQIRAYGVDPYGDYYTSRRTIFPIDEQDDRLHPKAVIFGIEIDGVPKAYPEIDLKELQTIEDNVNGVPIRVTRDEVGIITFTNLNTNERIPHERDFWFAWFVFHPDTELLET